MCYYSSEYKDSPSFLETNSLWFFVGCGVREYNHHGKHNSFLNFQEVGIPADENFQSQDLVEAIVVRSDRSRMPRLTSPKYYFDDKREVACRRTVGFQSEGLTSCHFSFLFRNKCSGRLLKLLLFWNKNTNRTLAELLFQNKNVSRTFMEHLFWNKSASRILVERSFRNKSANRILVEHLFRNKKANRTLGIRLFRNKSKYISLLT
jgi:hypothetical protein